MNEEWFKDPHGTSSRSDLLLIPTPSTLDSGHATTDTYSSRPEEAPFQFSCAISAQALMEDPGASTIPSSALVIALPEGLLDQDMECPTTFILSSPGAAPHAAAPPPTMEEDQSPSTVECAGLASIPLSVFPPPPPPVSAPPPAPLQPFQPAPKGRPKSKGSRAVAK